MNVQTNDDEISTIGINLGESYSCVGVFRHGKVQIIPSKYGNRVIPSYVAFTESEILVGEDAKNQAIINPENTIYQIHRLIGKKFDDEELQNEIKLLPYKVIELGNKPFILVKFKGEDKIYSPEEILSMILNYLKESAQEFLNKDIIYAVISAPPYFNDQQIQAIKDTGTLSGLKILRIIKDPIAALTSYGFDDKERENDIFLVYTLSDKRLDVSVIVNENGEFKHTTHSDIHFGIDDFNQIIIKYFLSAFQNQTGKDASQDKIALQKLTIASEKQIIAVIMEMIQQ